MCNVVEEEREGGGGKDKRRVSCGLKTKSTKGRGLDSTLTGISKRVCWLIEEGISFAE